MIIGLLSKHPIKERNVIILGNISFRVKRTRVLIQTATHYSVNVNIGLNLLSVQFHHLLKEQSKNSIHFVRL